MSDAFYDGEDAAYEACINLLNERLGHRPITFSGLPEGDYRLGYRAGIEDAIRVLTEATA